jgi:tetratricopeptide (TPR) repeat protein
MFYEDMPDYYRHTAFRRLKRHRRGHLRFRKGDYDWAIADFTQAIRLDPNYAKAYISRGGAYHNGKRDYDRAIADFETALRLDPNNATARNNLEIARRNRGRYGTVKPPPLEAGTRRLPGDRSGWRGGH